MYQKKYSSNKDKLSIQELKDLKSYFTIYKEYKDFLKSINPEYAEVPGDALSPCSKEVIGDTLEELKDNFQKDQIKHLNLQSLEVVQTIDAKLNEQTGLVQFSFKGLKYNINIGEKIEQGKFILSFDKSKKSIHCKKTSS